MALGKGIQPGLRRLRKGLAQTLNLVNRPVYAINTYKGACVCVRARMFYTGEMRVCSILRGKRDGKVEL